MAATAEAPNPEVQENLLVVYRLAESMDFIPRPDNNDGPRVAPTTEVGQFILTASQAGFDVRGFPSTTPNMPSQDALDYLDGVHKKEASGRGPATRVVEFGLLDNGSFADSVEKAARKSGVPVHAFEDPSEAFLFIKELVPQKAK